MGIDSRSSRFSMMSLGRVFGGPIPAPDGVIGQADRQHLIFLYSGISVLTVDYNPVLYSEIKPQANYFETEANTYYFETKPKMDYFETESKTDYFETIPRPDYFETKKSGEQ